MKKKNWRLASLMLLLLMNSLTSMAQTQEDSLANLTDEELKAYFDSIYDSRHPAIELSYNSESEDSKKQPKRQSQTFSYSNTYVPNSASVSTSNAVGQIDIQPGISPSGAKTYTIPIHGYKLESAFCPDISLTYNSQGGGSYCGKGWSIGGLQSITRANKSIYFDRKSEGIKMNAEDAFYLNGVRLVRTSTTAYEYETEQGNIKAVATVNDTIVKYFNVYFPNGYTAVFGMTSTTTNKQEYPITRLTDERGRVITYNYNSNYGSYWVTSIYYDYGCASITFTYDQTRADYVQGYRGGLILDNQNLLKSISCKRFSDKIGTYTLSYNTDANVSLLTRVDFSADGSYLNPLRFYYGDNTALQGYYTETATMTEGYDYHRNYVNAVRGRFDYHNGYDGVVIFPNSNPYYHIESGSTNYFSNKYNSNNKLLIYHELNGSTYNTAPSINLGLYFVTALTADLDGNQHESIIKVGNGEVGNQDNIIFDVYWKTNIGLVNRLSRTFYGPAVHVDGKGNRSVTPKSFYTGDFNGDGKMEVMAITADNPFGETNNPSMCYIFDLLNYTTLYSGQLLTYHKEFESKSITAAHAETLSDKIIPFDYDGDGKTDLCHIHATGMDIYTFIKNPNNNTVTARKVATEPIPDRFILENRDLSVGDFNGDGLMDFILSDAKNQYGTNSWRFLQSKGDGTFSLNVVTGPTTTNSTSEYVVQDVNGDGISDLIELTDNNFKTYLVRNNTMTPDVTQTLANEGEKLLPINLYSSSLSTQFASFRKFDLTFYSYKTNQHIDQALTGVVNSNAVIEKNYYYVIKRDNVGIYTKGSGATFPYSNVYEAIPVLAGSEVFKGGSSVDINKYYYTNAVVHRQGLGFCGFASVMARNKRNQSSRTTYDPYNHSLLTETDSPTSASTYDYSVTVDNYKRLKALVVSKTETDKLRNVTSTTNYTYDTYGQVLTENTSWPSGITENKTYTYSHLTDISNRYHLGRIATMTTTTTRGSSQHTEQTDITSYNSFDQPLTIINKVNGLTVKTTTMTYDASGNMTEKGIKPFGSSTARTSTYQYTSGNRLTKETDPMGAQRSYTYNTDGTVASMTASGRGTTNYTYDAFGRTVSETRPDNTVQNTDFSWSTVNGGLYAVTSTATNEPTTTVIYDALNREVRSTQQRFDGTTLMVDKAYDTYGNLNKESYPYKSGSPTYKQYTYDSYNRLTGKSEAGKTSNYSYSGLSTTVSDGTMSTTTTTDELGGVVSVTDPAGTINYTLNGAGNPTSISAPSSSGSNPTTTISYDSYGRRTSIADPSHGTTTYVYHGTEGYLQSETNAKNQTTSYVCDLYGRTTQRTTTEYSTSYTYNNNLNKVTAETSSNGTSTTYTYDNIGRLSSTTETGVDSKWLQRDYTYTDGKVSAIQYTSQSGTLATELYTYTNGHLTNVVLSNHIPVFNLKSEDNNGHTSSATVLALTRNYGFTVSGLPTSRSVTSGSQTYQSLTYNFNTATGNLSSVYNACNGLTENYTYDDLHRLTNYGGTSVEYDNKGNITEKGDIGSFAYNTTGKPYAVSDVTLTGSLPVGTQYVSYYSFDRPSMISDNGYSATFTYNGNYDRVKMEMLHNSQNTLTRYYLGGCYELDEKPTENMEKLYLLGGYYDSPLVLVKQNGSTNYYMVLRDHLGSITRIMGQQELSYDAWGRLRNPSTYEPYTPGSEPSLYLGRGYCGHEYLPEFGLINMNARLYDPLLGRFLSPDPYVQAPEHSQSFNRYSYCMNNPLCFVDKDGEFAWFIWAGVALVGAVSNTLSNSDNIHSIGDFCKYAFVGGAAGAAGLWAGGAIAGSGILYGALGGLVGGASSGFILGGGNAYLQNGDLNAIIKSAMYGMALGGISGAVVGGVIGGVHAYFNKNNIWNGNPIKSHTQWGTSPDTGNDVPIIKDETRESIQKITDEGLNQNKTTSITKYYPDNDGAAGEWRSEYLYKGTEIDRYGKTSGYYGAPKGTPLEMRSLPPNNSRQYNSYLIVKPIEVKSSIAAPWFNQIGLGIQYKFPINFEQMIQKGIIIPF